MPLWKEVEKGDVVTRTNTARRPNAAVEYEFVWLKRRGRLALCAFTKGELDAAEYRANENVEDMPVLKTKRWFHLF